MEKFCSQLKDARQNIIRDMPYIAPNPKCAIFLIKYAKSINSASMCSKILNIPFPVVHNKSLLLVSEHGAESTLLRLLYSADTLTIGQENLSWWETTAYHKREFQLCVEAMNRGYSFAYLGLSNQSCKGDKELSDKYQFELSSSFQQLWNDFMPTKVLCPFQYIDRTDIYEKLKSLGTNLLELSPCNISTSYCGNCMKCAEHFFILYAVGEKSLPKPSTAILKRIVEDPTDFYGVKHTVTKIGQYEYLKELSCCTCC